MTTPPALLDRITKHAKHLDALTDDMRQAAHERDEAIRAAITAGTPIVHIARAAGLSRQSVYEIRDRT